MSSTSVCFATAVLRVTCRSHSFLNVPVKLIAQRICERKVGWDQTFTANPEELLFALGFTFKIGHLHQSLP